MAGFLMIFWNLEILFCEIYHCKEWFFFSLRAHLQHTTMPSLMFIKMTACVMCISAALHGMTVDLEHSISQPGHSLRESMCEYIVGVLT